MKPTSLQALQPAMLIDEIRGPLSFEESMDEVLRVAATLPDDATEADLLKAMLADQESKTE